MNWTLAFIVPIAVTVLVGLMRRSAHEVHHSLLALYSGRLDSVNTYMLSTHR